MERIPPSPSAGSAAGRSSCVLLPPCLPIYFPTSSCKQRAFRILSARPQAVCARHFTLAAHLHHWVFKRS
jgi:hypothetical protein